MGEFVKAASANEIAPGTCRLVILQGKEIVVFNIDGEFFALDTSNVAARGFRNRDTEHRGGVRAARASLDH